MADPNAEPGWKKSLLKAQEANRARREAIKAGAEPAPPRRPPGRPRKEAALPPIGGGATVMPALDGTGPKPKAGVSVTRAEMVRQLVGGRMLVAMFLGLPPIQITPQEAAAEVDAIANALAAWGFDLEAVAGKWIATLGAVLTVVAIELPKMATIAQMRAAQAQSQAGAPPPEGQQAGPEPMGPAPLAPAAPGSGVAAHATREGAAPTMNGNGLHADHPAGLGAGTGGTGPEAPAFP